MTLWAEGKLAWINQYGVPSDDVILRRARDVRCVIIKWHLDKVERLLKANNIPWAVEDYAYPDAVAREGSARRLGESLNRGAKFAVINAEVEWETRQDGGEVMRALIQGIKDIHPGAEIYASIDARGNRLKLPFQRAMLELCDGILPEIYPLAFYPSRPSGFVASAFKASLDGKDFKGKPVFPTIQTYNGIGASAVLEQIAEVARRGLGGFQAYTLGHATDKEWQVIKEAAWDLPIPALPPTPSPPAPSHVHEYHDPSQPGPTFTGPPVTKG